MWVYGAGGHARVIVDCLESVGELVKGIIEPNDLLRDWAGYDVYKVIPLQAKNEDFIIAIGSNFLRKQVTNQLNCNYGIAHHKSAIISRDVKVHEGTVVFHRTVVQAGSVIGKHVIINTAATVDHDCQIGDYVHISPHASLCGIVAVGEGTQIGANATVIPGIEIGKWCMIGAGSVILKDVPDYAVVVGNPGKIIKYRDKDKYTL